MTWIKLARMFGSGFSNSEGCRQADRMVSALDMAKGPADGTDCIRHLCEGAALGGLDRLVLTTGIGENTAVDPGKVGAFAG